MCILISKLSEFLIYFECIKIVFVKIMRPPEFRGPGSGEPPEPGPLAVHGNKLAVQMHCQFIAMHCQLHCLYFYRAKRSVARYCHKLSVCPSVTLVDCDHTCWNSSKIISWLLALGPGSRWTPTSRIYTPKGTSLNFSRNRSGVE